MANSDLRIDGGLVRKQYRRTGHGQPEREWGALVLLEKHAPGLAPRPIAREVGPPAAVIMSRMPGAPIDEVLTRAQETATTAAYRELFAVAVPPDLPLRFAPPAAFVVTTADWLHGVERSGLPRVVAQALQAADVWVGVARPDLATITDPVAAQGDGNLANMIWDGAQVRLIDFEYAGLGDLAFEVADLVEHVSSRLRGLLEPEAMLAGFDLSDVQRSRVEGYRVVLAIFWLMMLLPGGRGREINPAGSDEHQAAHLLTLLARASS